MESNPAALYADVVMGSAAVRLGLRPARQRTIRRECYHTGARRSHGKAHESCGSDAPIDRLPQTGNEALPAMDLSMTTRIPQLTKPAV
jgi:hypothetical protein